MNNMDKPTIIKSGKELRYSKSEITVINDLPAGNYLLKFNQKDIEYYLEESDSFTIPDKVYGDPHILAKRYINTFSKGSGNLGVLLTGVKGTGKSLLAKMTCVESNLPVIMITEPYVGSELKSFLNNIEQEVIILLDEFEKTYRDVKHQETFLSLLDGVFEGKKLYIMTSNARASVSTYLLNRPSRVHYLKQYDGLGNKIIGEIIDDLLNASEHKAELVRLLNIAGMVTVDMLMAIIREMNMYGEAPKDAIGLLNIKPEQAIYKIEVYQMERKIGGKVDEEYLGNATIYAHPLASSVLKFQYTTDKNHLSAIHFNLEDSEISVNDDVIIVTNQDLKNKNLKVVCTPRQDYAFDFSNL